VSALGAAVRRGPGDLDAVGAVAAVAAGTTSAEALLRDARARAAAWEPALGAVVTALERTPVAGGPLHGAVLGIKDLMEVAGAPLGLGAPDLADPTPRTADATAVARLAAAGGTLAWTLQTHPLAYGIIAPQVANPRAPGRVAGGSSGGVAAALAAGFVHGGLGTDTGGSVRIPAACCGVVGLKTTRGLVPLTGVAALGWSLDTVGVLAATVADAALILDEIAGHDADDPVSEPAPPHLVAGPDPAAPLVIGVPTQVAQARMDDDVRAVWLRAIELLGAAGARVRPVELPQLDGANVANGRILAAEAAAVWEEAFTADPDRFHASIRPRLQRGLDARAVDVARARRHGTLLRAQLRSVLADVDVLCLPTLPCRVPPIDTDELLVGGKQEDVVAALTRFSNPWNLTGVPAGSVPAGRDRDGAPVGVQIVGPWWGEGRVLAAMAVIEAGSGGPWAAEPAPHRSSTTTGATGITG
jgi:aspartyl-tRNA(Asn)/glutamyl-tRNA(Gln) amidotransferase subunit A